MGDELPRLFAAVMAIETDLRAHLRSVERGQSIGDIARMARISRIMRCEPVLRRAMACLTANSVRGLEARPAACLRYIGRMAAKALRHLRRTVAKRARDLPAARAGEHCISAAVRPAGRGRLLPGCNLVLPNNGSIALCTAMTRRSGAARHAFIARARGLGLRVGRSQTAKCEKRCKCADHTKRHRQKLVPKTLVHAKPCTRVVL